jgi:hypothetical protein
MAQNLPELVKTAAVEARQLLLQFGIDDHFTVKLKCLPHRRLRDGTLASECLGIYRSRTAFRSRPIFWINPELPKIAADEGVSDKLYQIILDTILHEYGHVICEWSQHSTLGDAELRAAIENVADDEEDFAETFALVVSHNAASPAYREIAAMYMRVVIRSRW